MKIENRPTNASLSTMWAQKNCPDLNDFVIVAKQLGFQSIELNHQINSTMLSQLRLDHIQFSSIHEPCPADISTKELVDRDWLISSADEQSRKKGVESVKRSITLAHELSAPIVVVHCGTIPTNINYEGKLRALFKADKTESNEYLEIRSKLIELRAELIAPRLRAVISSMKELLECADQFMVKLGLENRYHYLDIPSIVEMNELLSLADSNQLGFIYDVGHAQALDLLGFYSHEDWLKRYSSRIFGSHLHDTIGLTDHYAPGLGEIDFYKIAPYLPKNSFRTFELLPGNTLAQINNGIKYLEKAGCISYL
jgi:sugar phosphate isomerase/epimerase